MQPESLLLRETLSLVVPKQGTLYLSHTHTHTHTHTHRKQTRRERKVGMTGVYKVQCAGDGRQVHLHGNMKTGASSDPQK